MKEQSPNSPSAPDMTAEQWRRIQEVFDVVADLETGERVTKLDELTIGDASLRAEVESLLTHDTVEHLPKLIDTELQASYKLGSLIGEPTENTEGRYRLLFPLAINNHSEVWCGEQLHNVVDGQNRVAVKFLRNESLDARRLDRFRTEAELLAKFRHPNIAEFIESGCTADEIPFIVTRFIPGQPITEYADEKQLTIQQRVELMIRVCDAVSYAHRFLVVHRDLKPSNILVTPDGQPVILDFGISKELSAVGENSDVTTTHERPMTPAYASPEQVRAETITTATDVHSLGLLLYEIMTGHHPFSAAAHERELALFDRISQSAPAKPSDIILQPARPLGSTSDRESNPRVLAGLRGGSPNQVRRQLKRGLDQVIGHAMQKTPDNRYHSVADLRNDLTRVRENRSVSVHDSQVSLQSSIQRRPRTWISAAVALGGVIAAWATNAWWQSEYQEVQHVAESSAREARQLQQETQQILSSHITLHKAVGAALNSDDESQISAEAIATIAPSARAALARRAIENGRVTVARTLIGDNPSLFAAEPMNVRANAAATYQQLGLPTNGLTVLGVYGNGPDVLRLGNVTDLANPKDFYSSETLYDLACVQIQLLNDAGLHDQAYELEELVVRNMPSHENDPRFHLISAAARHEIGWEDGFRNRVQWLTNRANGIGLAREQLSQLALLKARAASDLKKPKAGELLNKVVETVDGRSPHEFDVRCEALLLLSKLDQKSNEVEKAEARLREVLDLAEHQQLDGHRLVIKAMLALSELSEAGMDSESNKEWLERSWQTALGANELGTSTGFLIADAMMHEQDTKRVYKILDSIAAYRQTFRKRPYLNRAILIREFRAAVRKQDVTRALESSRQLVRIEAELWGDDSIENAFALACYGHALGTDKQNEQAAGQLSNSRAIIESLATDKNLPPAAAFFQPIVESDQSDRAKPFYQWIELYNQQNNNSESMQFQVLNYVATEIAKDFPKDHEILTRAMKSRWSEDK